MSLPLLDVVNKLEILAPLAHAESWDNVGLLVEPVDGQHVSRVLLTVDLTAAVFDEATSTGAELVVAYHPPWFKPLKRLSAREPSQRLIGQALARGIAVYSPHTALDAAPGGINDWLAEAVGPGKVEPLTLLRSQDSNSEFKLVVFVPAENADELRAALARAGAGRIGAYSECSFSLQGSGTFFGGEGASPVVGSAGKLERVSELRLEMVCSERSLAAVTRAIAQHHPYEEPAWDLYPLAAKPRLGTGIGRALELEPALDLESIITNVKQRLGVSNLRLAVPDERAPAAAAQALGQGPIRRVAVCAGAGGSVFERTSDFDLYLTGEMRHHDVLAKLAQGASVILCEHSSSERGYLPTLAERLGQACTGAVEVRVAEFDREPLRVV